MKTKIVVQSKSHAVGSRVAFHTPKVPSRGQLFTINYPANNK